MILYRRASVFSWGALIGLLGGLIGLGGAEFRLPILVSVYRFPTLQAIVINLIVSLVTVVFSFIFRGAIMNLNRSSALIVIDLLVGTLIGAFLGVRLATKFNENLLTRIVALFLAGLSLVLMGHDFIFHAQGLTLSRPLQFGLGTIAGILIGLVSSMLGVAGGELIIPTLLLLFGLDIKVAGSLSLAISIPTIVVGILRYSKKGKTSDLPVAFIVFMSLGSVLGALLGSRLLGYVSGSMLQILLGLLLLMSAFKVWRTHSQTKISRVAA